MLIVLAPVSIATLVTCLILLVLALLFLMDLVAKERFLIPLSVDFQNVTPVLPVRFVLEKVLLLSLVLLQMFPMLSLLLAVVQHLLQVVQVVVLP